MNILAIESASDTFSVSLQTDNELITKESREFRSASEKCAEYVSNLLIENNLKASDISYICVNKGPGSFTGLRVALSFAQGFAFPNHTPILGLNAFELLHHKSAYPDYYGVIECKRDELYISKSDLRIDKIKKKDLPGLLSGQAIITNDRKDLDRYLDDKQIIIRTVNSENLIDLFHDRLSANNLQDEDQIQLLYLNTFSKK
ncbi:MAG: tRNA (adenosine(37)-N6)-threonylcarbamoyltransferase complex dimerization subunit type 1 TsaB [Calditrichaeota bacterium]|nr:tRNA (adenosine(37)-N6)-threonylcarbamoyltransferase complex dimerization subunit type 1 TsaB [Calditrichota bacterium]